MQKIKTNLQHFLAKHKIYARVIDTSVICISSPFIEKYFDNLGGIIKSEEGKFFIYPGNELQAFFESKSHERKACNAAVKIIKEHNKLMKKRKNRFEMTIGICTGQIVDGYRKIAEDLEDPYIDGEAIRNSIALIKKNKQKGVKILVDRSTYKAVKDKFSFRKSDSVNKRIPCYELIL